MTIDERLGQTLARVYRKRLEKAADLGSKEFLQKSALVIAPHQDDETLGCGGTILRKRKAGADVQIVFMADGSTSHSEFMLPEELSALREQEALRACKRLGVEQERVSFLRLPEGEIWNHRPRAVQMLSLIFDKEQPEQVFIPYKGDPQPDHVMTNQIAKAALLTYRLKNRYPIDVYEYPIWFWFHWPWVPVWQRKKHLTKEVFLNSMRAGFGFTALREFKHAVDISSVLGEKRAALDEHRSQMTRLREDVDWPTLDGFCNGDFVGLFFQKKEWFRHSH